MKRPLHSFPSNKDYLFGVYFCPSDKGLFCANGNDIRKRLHHILESYRGDRAQSKVNLVYYWLQDATYADDTAAWLKLAKATASLHVSFFIALSGSGHMIHLISPGVVEAINQDTQANEYFMGLYLSEPMAASLNPTYPPQYHYWFNESSLELPLGILDRNAFKKAGFPKHPLKKYLQSLPESPYQWLRSVELHPANNAVVDTHTSINNPHEMMILWRTVLKRWFSPYTRFLTSKQSLFYLGHSPGDVATKFVSGFPFAGWSGISEVNKGSYSLGFAELRGISKLYNRFWGTMVGGVAWKYWQKDLKKKGLPHIPEKQHNEYWLTDQVPGWYFWIPSVIAWANGARAFVYESEPVQLRNNHSVRQANNSFHRLLKDEPDPMVPEVRCAFVKGDAYWANDLPGYEEGFVGERFSCRMNNRRNPGTIYRSFYPGSWRKDRWVDALFSGNPYGEVDFLPSHAKAKDLARYRSVVLYDYNTMTRTRYDLLMSLARKGAMVVLNAGHLIGRKNGRIDWKYPKTEDLFKRGRVADLIGCNLSGGSTQVMNTKIKGHSSQEFELHDCYVRKAIIYATHTLRNKCKVLFNIRHKPLAVMNPIGKGSVVTVLGPNYQLGLGQAHDMFFDVIARKTGMRTSYRVDGINHDEWRNLLVMRDTYKKRVVLVNYLPSYEMEPTVRLTDRPGRKKVVENITTYNPSGHRIKITMPARTMDAYQTTVSLPNHNVAIIHYDNATPQWCTDRFRLEYTLGAEDANTHSSFRLGSVVLNCFAQDDNHTVRRYSISIEAGNIPEGQWLVTYNVRHVRRRVKTGKLRIHSSEVLHIQPDVFGIMEEGDTLFLQARKCENKLY